MTSIKCCDLLTPFFPLLFPKSKCCPQIYGIFDPYPRGPRPFLVIRHTWRPLPRGCLIHLPSKEAGNACVRGTSCGDLLLPPNTLTLVELFAAMS